MKQLKINIDIDNTVNDFIEKFVYFCNEMRPTENPFYVDTMMEYSLEKDTNINDSVLSTLFFKNPSFYKQLKPLKDAEWVIENLNKDHIVKFVTSIDYDVIDARIQFINRYFPSVDIGKQLLVTDDKHSIYADIVIDDYITPEDVSPYSADTQEILLIFFYLREGALYKAETGNRPYLDNAVIQAIHIILLCTG